MAVIHTLGDLGTLVRLFRDPLGLSQEELAKAAGDLPRTAVAHLEQGHRLPAAEHLRALAKYLRLPDGLVDPFLRPAAARRVEFEAELGELVGGAVSIADLDAEAAIALESAIGSLMGKALTNHQALLPAPPKRGLPVKTALPHHAYFARRALARSSASFSL